MKAKEIIEYIETYFSLEKQASWDNSGLQLGNPNQEIQSIMIALNPDESTIKQAIDQGIHLLITHHPLFFDPIRCINTNDRKNRAIKEALCHDLVIYSAHTSLDVGTLEESMNTWACQLLNLQNLEQSFIHHYIRYGQLEKEMIARDFAFEVKRLFNLSHLQYVGQIDRPINKVAICLGSGMDDFDLIKDEVDVYITGDCKYHDAQSAFFSDTLLFNIPHQTEEIMKLNMLRLLEKSFHIPFFLAVEDDYIKMI